MAYQVEITKEDIQNELNVNLFVFCNQNPIDVKNFLNTVHRSVYDEFLYLFPNKRVQKLKIEKCFDLVKDTLRNMLLSQAEYLLANSGNIGMFNGSHEQAGGVVNLNALSDITEHIICPELFNMAISCEPALVYGGE